MRSHPNEWPDQPYRGLNYFRRQDRPLLAGRDVEIANCAERIAHPQTRVLLLNGATGCGKSSFIRAGLIPTMEEYGAGSAYLFLKTEGADEEALFIRCSPRPLEKIANQLYQFINAPFSISTPKGTRFVSLEAAKLNANSWEEYLELVRNVDGLIDSFCRFHNSYPENTHTDCRSRGRGTPTLSQSEKGPLLNTEAAFFYFLREFQQVEINARIIVTLRTEYFGRFVDAINQVESTLRWFYLSELSRDALVDAVKRPTISSQAEELRSPYDKYHFYFEDGLPELMVDSLMSTLKYSGPPLPILQLVCSRLYRETKSTNAIKITHAAFAANGGISGQLISHIRDEIGRIYKSTTAFDAELPLIRKFLDLFYAIQDDGTVVAHSRDKNVALERIAKLKITVSADDLLRALCAPSALILREVENILRNGESRVDLTLGHDSIALALERWKSLDALEAKRETVTDTVAILDKITSLAPSGIAAVTSSIVASLVVAEGITSAAAAIVKALSLSVTTDVAAEFKALVNGDVLVVFSAAATLVVIGSAVYLGSVFRSRYRELRSVATSTKAKAERSLELSEALARSEMQDADQDQKEDEK